jgi:hypothetical protein
VVVLPPCHAAVTLSRDGVIDQTTRRIRDSSGTTFAMAISAQYEQLRVQPNRYRRVPPKPTRMPANPMVVKHP